MKNIKIAHNIAVIIALLTLVIFFGATIIVESIGNHEQIKLLKLLKLLIMIFALGIMVPSTIIVWKIGKKVAKGHDSKLLKKKSKLFKGIQRIGPFILAPTGIALYFMAKTDNFGTIFYTVQLLKLIAQMTSITLIIMGIKIGIELRDKANN